MKTTVEELKKFVADLEKEFGKEAELIACVYRKDDIIQSIDLPRDVSEEEKENAYEVFASEYSSKEDDAYFKAIEEAYNEAYNEEESITKARELDK